jgi:tetratricopeptide (TPR) repeat protein
MPKAEWSFLRRHRNWMISLLLAATVILVYLPVRHYDFVNYDDPEYVTENPVVQAGLTWAGFKWAFTTVHAANWHPLTWLSLMLDCQWFGVNAGMDHLVNVCFHAANAALLFVLWLRLTGACWPSAFIAALFAWHPLRVESVAWVAERKDVLSAFFGLLTLLAYVGYAQRRGPENGSGKSTQAAALSYGLALLFFVLGLLAKPMLVTLPFVFLLLDYWPLRRAPDFELRFSPWLRLVLEKWPFFILAAASCAVTIIAQERGVAALEAYPFSSRIGNVAVAYVKYLFQSVYPVDLAVFYPVSKEIPWEQAAGALVVLAVISGLVWRVRRQWPYLLVGWLWYLGMLVPVIGLVQVGPQAMADRYTYLPLIGVFLGIGFGMADLAERLWIKPAVLVPAAVLVVGACLVLTAWQLRFWRDSETLFERDLAVTANNPTAQNNLGIALNEAGQPQVAIPHFQEALRLNPNPADAARAHNNWGTALVNTGHLQEAIEHFQEALRLDPGSAQAHNNLGIALADTGHLQAAMEHFREALRLDPGSTQAHNNLGIALVNAGRLQEAIEHFHEALRLKPGFPEARNNLCDALARFGYRLFQKGQIAQAVACLQESLQIRPDGVGARNLLGFIFLKQGRADDAAVEFQKVLALQPDNVEAQNNLAWIRATCPDASLRNGVEALQLAQRANQLSDGKNPTILATLAAAYAEAGRFPDAMSVAQKALALATARTNIAAAAALRAQIGCYEKGIPFRDGTLTNAPAAAQ